MVGKKSWIVPDGFLQPKSHGDQVSHEAICVLNITPHTANIDITIYFEDREPLTNLTAICESNRTHHIRLDQIRDTQGNEIPRGVPYAIKVDSNIPIILQHSRLDTSQKELALFTTMGYPVD